MYKGTKCPRDDRKFYCRLKCFTVHMYVFLSFLVIAIFPFSREDFRVVLLRFVDFTYFRINPGLPIFVQFTSMVDISICINYQEMFHKNIISKTCL